MGDRTDEPGARCESAESASGSGSISSADGVANVARRLSRRLTPDRGAGRLDGDEARRDLELALSRCGYDEPAHHVAANKKRRGPDRLPKPDGANGVTLYQVD